MIPELKIALKEYVDHKFTEKENSRQLLQTSDIAENEFEESAEKDPDFGDDTCEKVMMVLFNNFITYSDIVMHIFRNSGKDYNDYGRYEDCLNIHDFNYFMAMILNRFPIPFTIGICLPS